MTASYQHYATHDESEYPHLWEGVVGAWAPCLGPSGTRLHDHSGRANWGTLTNMDPATDWVVDRGQYALDFDGGNDNVDFGLSILLSSGPFSLGWWERLASAPSFAAVISFRTSAATAFIAYRSTFANYTNLAWRNSTSSSANGLRASNASTPASQIGLWNFFCITGTSIDSGNTADFAAYEKQSALAIASSSAFAAGTYTNKIAADGLGTFFPGMIDDIQIRDRQLSANEIAELYQIGRGGMYTPKKRRPIVIDLASSLRRRLLLMGQP